MTRWDQKISSATLTGDPAAQIQQILVRLGMLVISLIYLNLHAPTVVADHSLLIYGSSTAYLIYNALAFLSVRHLPRSLVRLLLSPLMDILLACLAIWADGGHRSPLTMLLLITVLGNGLRYGNVMLLYAISLTFSGLLITAVAGAKLSHQQFDASYAIMQILALIFIPAYAFLIGKKSEEAIAEQHETEQNFIRFLDDCPIPTFTYSRDADGNFHIERASPSIRAICPFEAGELASQPLSTVFVIQDDQKINDALAAALDHTPMRPEDFFYLRSRNSKAEELQLMCFCTGILWRHQSLGLCFMMDVSRTEKMREELERTRRLGYLATMAASITHDFRNVLTGIIGYAEILQMESEDEHIQQQLGRIIEAGEHGTKMIGQILQISRTNAENHQIEDLLSTLRTTISLARVQLPMAVRLHEHIDPVLPFVRCNVAQIEQVVLNLVSNAANAIEGEGNVHLELRADYRHKLALNGLPTLRISVSDDGCGIPAEDLENVFKPFWSTRKSKGGTGLGLAMIKRIVRWHHGDLEIHSEVGKGTQITLWLPPASAHALADDAKKGAEQPAAPLPATTISQPPAPLLAPPPPVKPTAPAAMRPCRILLVDDNEDVLKVHESLLARMQHTLITACDGDEALRAFIEHRDSIDLLATDFRMPGMDGIQLSRQLRALCPDLPILMITGFGEDESLQESHDLRIRLLVKPVSYAQLEQAITSMQNQEG